MEKVKCTSCDAMILLSTSSKNDGLCASCYKLSMKPIKVPPSKTSFYAAAIVLFMNAAATGLLLLKLSALNIFLFGMLIDFGLGVLLLKRHEGARLLVIVRAALGFVMFGALGGIGNTISIFAERLIAQAVFSGSLLLFLVWPTVRWRFNLAVAFAIIYFLYSLVVFYIIFV